MTYELNIRIRIGPVRAFEFWRFPRLAGYLHNIVALPNSFLPPSPPSPTSAATFHVLELVAAVPASPQIQSPHVLVEYSKC